MPESKPQRHQRVASKGTKITDAKPDADPDRSDGDMSSYPAWRTALGEGVTVDTPPKSRGT
jgi:hypothetical protein